MKIALGADHRGFQLKEQIREYLEEKGVEIKDFGTTSEESVDYPDFAFKVAESVARRQSDIGIIICFTGIGMSIAANKVRGIRAALCVDEDMASYARAHNDANVLVLSSGMTDPSTALTIIETWLEQDFEGGRHRQRINKISAYEDSAYRG
jgi:ribose 5-phosphate isomerase B